MGFGAYDSQYVDIPDIFDRAYLDGLASADGLSAEAVISQLDGIMADFNGSLDGWIASLAYSTREPLIEYEDAPAFDVTPTGEYGMPRIQQGESGGGWMLPLRSLNLGLGWTKDGLAEMESAAVTRQLNGVLKGFRNAFRKNVFVRFFGDQEVPVQPVKTTALSPGLAGSGTGTNVYDRPYPNGKALPGGYTHYIRTTSATLLAAIVAGRDKLLKQGHIGPYDLVCSQATLDLIVALPGWVPAGSALIRSAPANAEALVDATIYVGVIAQNVKVRMATDDFTDLNLAIYKSYGPGDDRNPIAIRYPKKPWLPDDGAAAYLRSQNINPLAEVQVIAEWGVGIGNRVGVVLISIAASGPYVPPTLL